MKTNTKVKVKVAILACAITAMLYNTFTGVLTNVSEVCGVADNVAASLMTLPVLIAIPVNVIVGILTRWIRPKVLMIVCLLFAVFGGFPLFIQENSLTFPIMMGAVVLTGMATSMVTTLINTMITQECEMAEQFSMMGLNNGFGSFGAVALSLLGGLCVSKLGLNFFYLPMFIGCIIILVVFIICSPKTSTTPPPVKGTDKIPAKAWFYVIYLALYMTMSMSFLTQLSMRVTLGFGYASNDPVVTSLVPTVTLLGGAVVGCFTGKISAVCGKYTIALGPLIAMCGHLTSLFAKSLPVMLLAGVLIGAALSISLSAAIFGTASTVPESRKSLMMGLSNSIGNLVTYSLLNLVTWPLAFKLMMPVNAFYKGATNAGPIAVTLTWCAVGCLILAIAGFIRARLDIKEENNFDDFDFDGDFGA